MFLGSCVVRVLGYQGPIVPRTSFFQDLHPMQPESCVPSLRALDSQGAMFPGPSVARGLCSKNPMFPGQ